MRELAYLADYNTDNTCDMNKPGHRTFLSFSHSLLPRLLKLLEPPGNEFAS